MIYDVHHTDLITISSIALGYQNSGSFRIAFLKQIGLRPNEYRGKFNRIWRYCINLYNKVPFMQKLSLTKTVGPYDLPTACDFLAACTSLSKSRIKDAMIKGAVWLKRKKKQQRLRRATAGLKPGDVLSIYMVFEYACG